MSSTVTYLSPPLGMDRRTWILERVGRRLALLLHNSENEQEDRNLVEAILFENDLWHGNTEPQWGRRQFIANVIEANPELWEAVGYLRYEGVYELIETVEELILSIIPAEGDVAL